MLKGIEIDNGSITGTVRLLHSTPGQPLALTIREDFTSNSSDFCG